MLCLVGLLAFAGGTAMGKSSDTMPDPIRVRQIGYLDSAIAPRLLEKVNAVPFAVQRDSPVLLQGATLSRMKHSLNQQLRAPYRAGYTIVLLDATAEHIEALHDVVNDGVASALKDGEVLLAYALRQERRIPKATLLLNVRPSPLRTPAGDPEPTALQDDERALERSVDRGVAELAQQPNVIAGMSRIRTR